MTLQIARKSPCSLLIVPDNNNNGNQVAIGSNQIVDFNDTNELN
ncbi:hypothetical protein [Pelagicoccus sp. SDUM812002]|nr:hypothetical protein [Pelagicoccus sp. SDUM812002]MDQ8184374.1 hypothetical protein [Pelagicoccus sp. SDUM812002]